MPMSRYEDNFPSGTEIEVSCEWCTLPMQGEVVANYGHYLIVKPRGEYQLKPGQQITVTVLRGQERKVFNSYVCFWDDEMESDKHFFCIYVPADLAKIERRKYLRINVELVMIYHMHGLRVTTKTINVSAGGAYFFAPERLGIGQEIQMELTLFGEVLTLKAKVVRTMLNAASVEFMEEGSTIDRLASYLYRCSRIS